MERPRSPPRVIPRRRSAYRPPPLGFSDVRFFVDKFEAHYNSETATAKCADLENSIAKYSPVEGSYFGDFSPDESASGVQVWRIIFWKLGGFLGRRIPRVSLGSVSAFAVAAALVSPKMISYLLLYPFCRLVFGTLYPAYASYKAVRTKNLKEYVKWMMYWIVFALFTCAETFTDVFLSWFPFYYEVKIVLVLWLLSPATKGSSILYRKFVHPALSRREQEIDDAISKAKDQGYHTVLNLGSKGVNYATAVIMQTAIRGGGGLVQQLKKSYSLSDLTEAPRPGSEQGAADEADDVITDPRLVRRSAARSGYNTRRSASESNNRTPVYFSEVDVDVRTTRSSARGDAQDLSHIKSSEDVSSGYSSAENSAALARAGSLGARRTRLAGRAAVTPIKRPGAAEGSEVIIEELQDNENFDFTDLPPLLNLPPTYHISQTNPPFLFEYVGNQINIVQMLGNDSRNFTFENKANFHPIFVSNSHNSNDETSAKGGEMDEKEDNVIETKIETIPETSPKEVPNIIIPSNVTVEDDVIKTGEVFNAEQTLQNVTLYTINNEDNKGGVLDVDVRIVEGALKIASTKTVDSFESKVDDSSLLIAKCKSSPSMSSSSASLNSAKTSPSTGKDDSGDAGSIETSSINEDAGETDDEASYGTPDDSPKAKKKYGNRGKYGKSKAPPPPIISDNLKITVESQPVYSSTGGSEKEDAKKSSREASPIKPKVFIEPNIVKVSASSHNVKGYETPSAHGHISKRKHRQRSKSPVGRKTATGSSPISRLMQLPGKLAFWSKNGDKSKADTWSTSSDERSRRSSTAEKVADEFQSCVDLQEALTNTAVDIMGPNENIPTITISPSPNKSTEETAVCELLTDFDLEESAIAKNIIDKSDALQKLIEAKLESHPEYKIVPLHEDEIPTTSKSTEV